MGAIAMIGLMVAVFVSRNKAVLRAASPPLLQCALFGSALAFVLMAVAFENPPTVVGCSFRAYGALLAFGMVYGALVVRLYRIHLIFSSKQLVVRSLPNSTMLKYYASLVSAVCLFIVVWASVSPVTVERVLVLGEQSTQCSGGSWVQGADIVRLLVLVLAAALAVSTRNAPEAFTDSRMMGMVVYSALLLGVMLALVRVAVKDPAMQLMLTVVLSALTMPVVGCSMVIPKLFAVWAGKGAELTINTMGTAHTVTGGTGGSRAVGSEQKSAAGGAKSTTGAPESYSPTGTVRRSPSHMTNTGVELSSMHDEHAGIGSPSNTSEQNPQRASNNLTALSPLPALRAAPAAPASPSVQDDVLV
jgi:hypothetical protein